MIESPLLDMMLDISYNIRMTAMSDGRTRLSEVAICRIAGIDRNRRRPWAAQGLLARRGKQGYNELDTAELVVFRLLVAELDFDRAREAWGSIRSQLRGSLLAGKALIVFDEGRGGASVATTPDELFAAAGRRGRYQVVDASEELADARTGFRSAVQALSNRDDPSQKRSKVQHLRQKSIKNT